MRAISLNVVLALLVALSGAAPAGAAAQGTLDAKVAKIKAAIEKAGDDGDPRAEFKAITDLALLYYNASKFDDALREFQHALAFAKECEHLPDQGRAYVNLAVFSLDHENNRDRALEYLKLAVDASHKGGDAKGEAAALENLASIYDSTDRKQAAAYRKQAADAMREYDAVSREWNALKKSGGDRAAYNAFIEKYPNNYFAEFARADRPSASATLATPAYAALFKDAARRVSEDPSLTVVVDGFASPVDEPEFDDSLVSMATVALVKDGVPEARIVTRRFGSKCPAADGRTFRVELRFLKKGESVDKTPATCP